jgi:hypothetical protein
MWGVVLDRALEELISPLCFDSCYLNLAIRIKENFSLSYRYEKGNSLYVTG